MRVRDGGEELRVEGGEEVGLEGEDGSEVGGGRAAGLEEFLLVDE